MLSDKEKAQEMCNLIGHQWREEYYGLECENCREFIPYGCEPWGDDYEPETCPYCGKEYEDFDQLGCSHCDVRVRL